MIKQVAHSWEVVGIGEWWKDHKCSRCEATCTTQPDSDTRQSPPKYGCEVDDHPIYSPKQLRSFREAGDFDRYEWQRKPTGS